MHTHILYISFSGFDIVSLVAVIGALSCRLWVLPLASVDVLHPRLWRFLAWALLALTVSSLALLVGRTLEMSRQPLSAIGPILPLVVRKTQFGHIWLIRPVSLVILWLCWFTGRHPGRGGQIAIPMFLLVAVIAFTRSATGHPADGGQFTPPEWVDWVHLMVASIWAGSLFAMMFGIFPSLQGPGTILPAVIAELGNRLSRLASIALGLVLISGFLSARHDLVHLDNLWRTSYGRILLVKLSFVSAAMLLGALNRYLHIPCIRCWAGFGAPKRGLAALPPLRHRIEQHASHEQTAPLRPLARTIAVEAFLLFGALLTAAVLLHGMPPSDVPPVSAMTSGHM
ncbi:MAG: copper resistance D family protein [Acidiferrobacteraceae bacterium]